MECWTGSQRQPPQYSKYGTVPGQNLSHVCREKQHTPGFQQPLYERDLSRDMNWWTVPGSRTGWVLRDHSNSTGTQPPDFPFTLDSQPRSQGFSKQQGLERAEREWARAEMERVHKEQESERKMQREGWGRSWEPCSPFRYRRDCKRSMSDSSQRELEAWASRYCHSLPRKRRMEAGMWGAQGFHRGQAPERERFSQWVGRDGSADFQGTYHPPTQNPPMRGWRQEEIRQPAIPFRPPQSSFLKGSWEQDRKENELSYQQRVSSQPPSYNHPPPYSAPHYSPLTQQPQKYVMKDTVSSFEPILAQPHAQEGNFGMHVASVEQEVDVRTVQQGEEAWAEEWNNREELDLHFRERYGDSKTGDASPPPPKPLSDNSNQAQSKGQPEFIPELKEETLPEAKCVKARLKKKRVRETIFCLVSRLGGVAGLSSSPEDPLQSISLPLSSVPNMTGTAGTGAGVLRSEGSGEGSTGIQLADEIDSKVTDQHQFSFSSTAPPLRTPIPKMDSSSRCQAAQTWTENEQEAAHREELFQALQTGPRYQTRRTNCQSLANAEDTEGSKTKSPQASAAPEMSKRAQQPHGSVKFPLWKEPSLVAQMNTNPASQCIKGSWEQQGGAVGDPSHDQDDSSNAVCGHSTEESMLEHKTDSTSDGSSGIFIIDATCVVVRAEFISPPKKELVQYPPGVLNPGPLNSDEIINDHPAVTSEQESDVLLQDCQLQECGEETEGSVEKQELLSQELDSEQNLLPGSPSETDVSHSISSTEAEGMSECPDTSLPNLVIPANETLEERAVRILGIPLLGSSVEETKSMEQPPDSAVHHTGEVQQSSSDPPSMEQGSDATHETGQDEDQNYLQDSDTADNQVLDGENTPGMGTEVRSSQEEEPKSMEPSVHESSEENEADICTEIQDIIVQETDSEERVSSYPEINQDASSQSEGIIHCLPSPSENLCLAPTYFDSPPHSPPKSPTLMSPLSFSLPMSGSPTNDLLQEPSPLLHTASCCSLSGSASCTCSASRAHSPLCPICPPSNPLDSTSLAHFPSPPLSPFVPHSPSNLAAHFDLISNSEHQSPRKPVEILPPPQSLSPLQREEPQYPKSLWDAVYRIRKHTAPDSENEEEEGGELWDNPENVNEDGEPKEAQIDLVHKREMDRGTVETALQSQEVLDEDSIDNSASPEDQPLQITALEGRGDTETPDTKLLGENVGIQEGRQGEEELCGQVDDDTLSCSSSDSHASRDTVIMGKEEAGGDRTGVGIGEGVEDNEMRVGTEAKQTNEISLSCKDEICGSSEELLVAEETRSYGKTLALTELCPTKECFGDGDETAVVGETDNKHTVETNLGRDDGECVSAISGEGEMGDSVCLGALEHSNLREGKQECVTVEIVKSVECCIDTSETKGNQDIGFVAENKDVNEDVRHEKICIETSTCITPEEGAGIEEETCTCHTAEYQTAEDATANTDSASEPRMGFTCDSFVTEVVQQGVEPAEVTDQQETDIWPPEEEGNHSSQDIQQDLQEADSKLFEEK